MENAENFKEIKLVVKAITTDITKEIAGYKEIYVERVYGNLLFLKNKVLVKDAIKIENGETYKLNGITQIYNPLSKKAKSYATLTGYLKK